MAQTTKAVQLPGHERIGYGSGWWANLDTKGDLWAPMLPPDTYMANGHDGQLMVIVPSQHLVVLRMGFTESSDEHRSVLLAADIIADLTRSS